MIQKVVSRSLTLGFLVLILSVQAFAGPSLCRLIFSKESHSNGNSPIAKIKDLGKTLLKPFKSPPIQTLPVEQVVSELAFQGTDEIGRKYLNTPLANDLIPPLAKFPDRPISVKLVREHLLHLRTDSSDQFYTTTGAERTFRWHDAMTTLAIFYKQDTFSDLKSFVDNARRFRNRATQALNANIITWPIGLYSGHPKANLASFDGQERYSDALQAVGRLGRLTLGTFLYPPQFLNLAGPEGLILVNPRLSLFIELEEILRNSQLPEAVFLAAFREFIQKEGDVYFDTLIEKLKNTELQATESPQEEQ